LNRKSTSGDSIPASRQSSPRANGDGANKSRESRGSGVGSWDSVDGRWRWDLGDWRLLPPGRLMFDAPSVGSGRLINMPMTWPLFLDTPDLLRSPSDLQLEGLYQINESEECNLLLIIVGRLREGVPAIAVVNWANL